MGRRSAGVKVTVGGVETDLEGNVNFLEKEDLMAVSGKYGRIGIPKIGEDEPVFILRAQDRLAQGIVEIYKVLAASHESPLAKELDREIERFRQWKGPKKMPD